MKKIILKNILIKTLGEKYIMKNSKIIYYIHVKISGCKIYGRKKLYVKNRWIIFFFFKYIYLNNFRNKNINKKYIGKKTMGEKIVGKKFKDKKYFGELFVQEKYLNKKNIYKKKWLKNIWKKIKINK